MITELITIKLKQFLIIHHFDQFNVNYFENIMISIHGIAYLLELYIYIYINICMIYEFEKNIALAFIWIGKIF